MAEEVRRVQSRHRRVLGELNLSVEAMLMPTAVDNNEEREAREVRGASTEELLPTVGCPADDLLSRVGCDMDSGFSGSSSASYRHVSRINCLITFLVLNLSSIPFIKLAKDASLLATNDTFSVSLARINLFLHLVAVISSRLVASSLNPIRRSGLGSLRRGMGKINGSESTGIQRKTKAAMIWKKGWKGWKKLHSFGSSGGNNKTIVGEFENYFYLYTNILTV